MRMFLQAEDKVEPGVCRNLSMTFRRRVFAEAVDRSPPPSLVVLRAPRRAALTRLAPARPLVDALPTLVYPCLGCGLTITHKSLFAEITLQTTPSPP